MTIVGLTDRDLRALARFGSDEQIVAAAIAELGRREILRGGSEPVEAHNLGRVGATPAPATSVKGRWDV